MTQLPSRILTILLLGLSASADAAPPGEPMPIPATPAIATASDPTIALDAPVRSTIVAGTAPQPITTRPARKPPEKGDISVNFPAAELSAVARAVLGLMTRVAQIKARGDKAAAEQLLEPYVKEGGDFAKLRAVMRERWLRVPKAAFVYAVGLN